MDTRLKPTAEYLKQRVYLSGFQTVSSLFTSSFWNNSF